jgi:hypothetical protein
LNRAGRHSNDAAAVLEWEAHASMLDGIYSRLAEHLSPATAAASSTATSVAAAAGTAGGSGVQLSAADTQRLVQEVVVTVEGLLGWMPAETSLLGMRLRCLQACSPVVKVCSYLLIGYASRIHYSKGIQGIALLPLILSYTCDSMQRSSRSRILRFSTTSSATSSQ